MVERYGLFVIIVLGEVVVGVVDGLSEVDRDLATVATGVLALVVGFGFWWNYFDLAGRRLPRDSSAALATWLFAHLPLTAAVAAAGAGMVSLVEHADDARTPTATAWLIAGSVTVMLLSLVAVVRPLEDAGRLPELYRPMPAVLASAAAVALLLGWARPAPWLLAHALDLVLTATWWVAFAGWVRSGMRTHADAG